jgi:hypothetical protein
VTDKTEKKELRIAKAEFAAAAAKPDQIPPPAIA